MASLNWTRASFASAYAAGAVFAAPFAVLVSVIGIVQSRAESAGSAPGEGGFLGGMIMAVVADAVLALVPGAFYVYARRIWPRLSLVEFKQVYGWPMAIAAISSVGFGLVFLSVQPDWLPISIMSGVAILLFGLVASCVWLRLAYQGDDADL